MKINQREGDRKGRARRRDQRVIADAWKGLASKPRTREVAGGEEIVDKFWIDAEGKLIHHGLYRTHQEVALDYLREHEAFRVTKDRVRDMLRAEAMLLRRGFIRGQVYAQEGLGLQGKPAAIRAHGAVALSLVPRPRRLYVAAWPGGETSIYTAKDVKKMLGTRYRGNKEAA